MKAVVCKKMFDPQSMTVKENMVIFVEGDKVSSVVPAAQADTAGCEVFDMGDKFVTPGLIDGHVHLTFNGQANPAANWPYMTIGDFTLAALRAASDDLQAGFTSLRVCGDTGFAAEAVRDAIDSGAYDGPRLMTSGGSISTTGGHADDHYGPYLTDHVNKEYVVGDGPDELARAVRYNIKYGADFIKFMSTGGVMSRGTTVGAQQMSYEEMKSICDTAKSYGVITATHAHGTNGIKDAVRAGVTTIEHGMMLDEECIELMKQNGTYLVPTLIAAERIIVKGREIGTPEWAIKKAETVFARATGGFARCMEEGIPICFGTDAATPYNFHGKQAYEFELMNRYGMPVLETLKCATKVNAEMMRKYDTVGSIEPGKFADIAAFDGDPREDITCMTRCVFVMKGGKVCKQSV